MGNRVGRYWYKRGIKINTENYKMECTTAKNGKTATYTYK